MRVYEHFLLIVPYSKEQEIKELAEQLAIQEAHCSKARRQYERSAQILNDAKYGVEYLFKKLECLSHVSISSSPSSSLLQFI